MKLALILSALALVAYLLIRWMNKNAAEAYKRNQRDYLAGAHNKNYSAKSPEERAVDGHNTCQGTEDITPDLPNA